MSDALRRVVIVGAGFGGLSAAQALAKASVEITIIDRQNHHLFQPLLYQVATAALTPADIATPIRQVLRGQTNARVVMDEVTGIDKEGQKVICASGIAVPYDALILSTGSTHSYFGNDDWAEIAPGLKTLKDALGLREKILSAFEKAELVVDKNPDLAASYQRFVVVGAGPTGVEMAGAIAELAQSLKKDFRKIDASKTEIILVEGGPRVLPSFAEDLSVRAARDLISLGVTLKLNTMVTGMIPGQLSTNDEEISVQTVIWAAGVKASSAARWLEQKDGHVEVDETLRPAGHENIFVIGDTAKHLADGKTLPGIAPVAKQMGEYVGRRLQAVSSGETFNETFAYKDAGSLATIGRNRAVADVYGLKLTGFLGWVLWGGAHVYFLIGFKSRLFVMLTWIWSYVTWQKGVRLIMDRDASQPFKKEPRDFNSQAAEDAA